MAEIRTADVVQEMIWKIVKETGITQEELGRFMEAWAEIRRMETAQATYEVFTPYPVDPEAVLAALRSSIYAAPGPSQGTESTPEGVQKVRDERVEKVHEGGAEIPLSVGSADSSPQGGPVVQNEPGYGPETEKKLRDNAAAGKASLATRKKNALEKVEELRAAGVGVGKIADADKDLTVVAVLDFLDRKPIPLPKLAAIERAVKKLEAET